MTYKLFRSVLRDEMWERNWGMSELAHKTGLSIGKVFDILNMRVEIDKDLAISIGSAFGTSWELWKGLYDEKPLPFENNLESEE